MRRWIVDAWNVVGSRPDGWWRDRPGALGRLLDEITRWRTEIGEAVVVVADGEPAATGPPPGLWYGVDLRYTHTSARNAGDDQIIELLDADPVLDPRRHEIAVVTSDRDLADRAGSLGATVEGARTFRRRLADIGPRRRDRAVLAALGTDESALLGRGGEARVFALDDDRVVRLPHQGATDDDLAARTALVAAIDEAARSLDLPFAVPRVLEQRTVDGTTVVIERRLPGRSALDALSRADTDRVALIRSHLDAAAAIAAIPSPEPWFGERWGLPTARWSSFRDWSVDRLARSLAHTGGRLGELDPVALTDDLLATLPDVDGPPVLVHLDAFLGNMLAEDDHISAVVDFGPTTIGGVRGLDPVAAIACLAPEITPGVDATDVAVAMAWATDHDLPDAVAPARRWTAAFWAWADDDERLHTWCRRILVT
ncbi:MAG: hypothetical protein ACK5OX_16060 [Desertimonas sp.]